MSILQYPKWQGPGPDGPTQKGEDHDSQSLCGQAQKRLQDRGADSSAAFLIWDAAFIIVGERLAAIEARLALLDTKP